MHKKILLALSMALPLGLSAPVLAQNPPAKPAAPKPPAAVDLAYEAAKKAYEALPLAERKAIQDGLIWSGEYKGAADGEFGKRTRDAILAYAGKHKLPLDGMLDSASRTALAASTHHAKAALKFGMLADAGTGIHIGIPQKLLQKSVPGANGTRYVSADGAMAVETFAPPIAEGDLPAVFESLKVERPNRKVTYKVLKPDFLVVAGESGSSTFYTRYDREVQKGEIKLRGYTFFYPTKLKEGMEPLALSIAASFDPFGKHPIAPVAGASVAAIVAPPPPAAPPSLATGLIIAADRVVTSLPKVCNDPNVAGKKASAVKRDGDLAVLTVPGLKAGTAVNLRVTPAASPSPVVVLAFAPGNPPALSLASGEMRSEKLAFLALQGSQAGAAVFDKSGALVGLTTASDKAQLRYAGIVPQMTYPLASGEVFVEFLKNAGLALPPNTDGATSRTSGEIAALRASSLVPIQCGP